MPEKSFGYVPTPALVAPIEFTLRADDYAALGGYASRAVIARGSVLRDNKVRVDNDADPTPPACPTAACICSTGRSTSSSRPSARRTRSRRPMRQAFDALRRHPADAGARAADPAPPGRRRLSAAAGPGRAAHGRGGLAASRRLHHADGRGRRRRRRRDAGGDDGRPHARQGLRQQRRRHRLPSRARPGAARRHLRRCARRHGAR